MKKNDDNNADPSVAVPRLVRYSADVQEDATGQFYIDPVTGLRVDKPADGWLKTGHNVTFTPIKISLAEKINLGLSTSDGKIIIGKSVDGRCYLIAEADRFANKEVFDGLGSTEHTEISKEAFLSLASKTEMIPDWFLSRLETLITEDDEGKTIQVGTKMHLAVKVRHCATPLLCDEKSKSAERHLQDLMRIGLDAYTAAVKSHLAR